MAEIATSQRADSSPLIRPAGTFSRREKGITPHLPFSRREKGITPHLPFSRREKGITPHLPFSRREKVPAGRMRARSYVGT